MRLRFLFLSLFCTLSFSLFAQVDDPDLFYGKWVFDSPSNMEGEELDSMQLKMMERIFKDLTFVFQEDGLCEMQMMGKEEMAKWVWNEDQSAVIITSKTGQNNEHEIIELTADKMIFGMGRKPMVLKRAEMEEGDVLEEVQVERSLAEVTGSQLIKTWYLKETSKDRGFLMKAAFTFNEDGTAIRQLGPVNMDGTWKLDEAASKITMIGEEEDGSMDWYVKEISEDRLVLYRGTTEETWTMTTEPWAEQDEE
ncbi:MAG: hypothetical protein AAFR61_24380 [Bacteroidota bacterium]